MHVKIRLIMQLKPSNDFCESMLGLNDFLTTTVPNFTRELRSNLVQVKKPTLRWLSTLPEDDQTAIVDMAVQQRRFVTEECRREEKVRAQQRQQKMVQ